MRGGLQSAEEGGREGRGGVRKGRCRRRDGGEGGERKPVGWAGGWVWGGRAHKPQPARRWVTAVEGLGLGGGGVTDLPVGVDGGPGMRRAAGLLDGGGDDIPVRAERGRGDAEAGAADGDGADRSAVAGEDAEARTVTSVCCRRSF